MVTVKLNTGTLDVLGNFTYTRQVGDIGDVATSNANFTNSFEVRRDKTSISALNGLSLVGSLSNSPYIKVKSLLHINGIDLISDGWLQIRDVDKDKFKLSVLDGNVDFWKAIENVALDDIDLSEADHDKNLQSVIASFSNDYYKYILADYGGQTFPERDNYNIDHLPPAISEDYIFRRIFSYIGMTYSMPINIDTWLTYPKDTSSALGFEDSSIITANGFYTQTNYEYKFTGIAFNLTQANSGAVLQGQVITGLEQGYYNIESIASSISAEYVLEHYSDHRVTLDVNLDVNVYLNISGRRLPRSATSIFILPTDTIEFEFVGLTNEQLYALGYGSYSVAQVTELNISNFQSTIKKYIFQEIRFGDALKDIKATDFIKYMMHRYGLTMFYDNKKVTFKTIEQRLDADTINYSRFFKERDKEKYTYSSYAQENILAHKYVDEDVGFNDGVIYVNNKNLRESRTLLESFTYSPTRTGQLTIFEAEPYEDDDGDVKINYKGIDRNFSIKMNLDGVAEVTLRSIIENDSVVFSGTAPIVNLQGTTFREYKNMYYTGVEKILNNTKIHNVTFKMSIYEFLHIDLSKKLYLRQEASEYLINSATLRNNDEVTMELIKLN